MQWLVHFVKKISTLRINTNVNQRVKRSKQPPNSMISSPASPQFPKVELMSLFFNDRRQVPPI